MRKLIIVLLIAFSFGSCATILTKKEYNLKISSYATNSSVTVNDSVYQLPADILVKRSNKDLPIVFKTDSVRKNLILRPSVNWQFLIANLSFVYACPAAYLVDFTTPKRFYYRKNIMLSPADTNTIIRTRLSEKFRHLYYVRIPGYFNQSYHGQKGQVNFISGVTLANDIYTNNAFQNRRQSTYGGMKTGIEYFYSDRSYLAFSLIQIVPTGIFFGEHFEEYDETSTSYAAITNNYGFRRFTFGYGVHYSFNTTKYYDGNIENENSRRYRNETIGPNINFHYRIIREMYAGFTYRPDLLLLKPETEFRYEHLISFELIYKIRLRRGK